MARAGLIVTKHAIDRFFERARKRPKTMKEAQRRIIDLWERATRTEMLEGTEVRQIGGWKLYCARGTIVTVFRPKKKHIKRAGGRGLRIKPP